MMKSNFYSLYDIITVGKEIGVLFSVADTERYYQIQTAESIVNGRKTTLIYLYETTELTKVDKDVLLEQFYQIMNATVSHEMKTPLNAIISTSR